MRLAVAGMRLRLYPMNTLLEIIIIGAWIAISVIALTRVVTERRRWIQKSAADAIRMTSANLRH